MSVHSPVPASGAPVWGVCSASIPVNLAHPEQWSKESDEGTAAHWVGSETLENWQLMPDMPANCWEFLGKTAPNGVVIDEKMVEGAQIYVDDVLACVESAGAGTDQLQVERRTHPILRIHPENGGTFDAALVQLEGPPGSRVGTVGIWDYKHGHRPVNAKENLQMVNYLAALVQQLDINGAEDQVIRFVVRVVQPFAYSAKGVVSEWTGYLSDLRAYFNQLHQQATEGYSDKASMTAGLHCRDCPAVGRCPAARSHLYAFLDYGNQPYEIDTMDSGALATERRIVREVVSVAKSRLQAIEDELEHRIKNGDTGSGLTLQVGEGHLKWTCPAEEAIAIAAQFGADISSQSVKTPTQAKQLVPKDMRLAFSSVIESVASRPPTSASLIETEESRTALAFKKPEQ